MKVTFTYLCTLCLLLLAGIAAQAQVTTASMSGVVVDDQQQPLPGAMVLAMHLPTGAEYGAVTEENGAFRLVNLPAGGPYRVEVSFIGYRTQRLEDIYLKLGQDLKLNIKLVPEDMQLEAVEISAERDLVFDASRTGASTNITREQVENMPTLSRGLQDFVRLTPQFAPQDNGGLSFAGQNNRYNNVMIDGAVNNDVFGLNDQGTPGGRTGSQPISLDAIQEIQVLIAPFDVRQGNFVGGGVNAITRSGSNKVEGSAYFYGQNSDMVGRKVGDNEVDVTKFTYNQMGFRVGGPVIKNKLFFFVNGEIGRRTQPYSFDLGSYVNNDPAQLQQLTDELNQLRQLVINKFGYDPGDPTQAYDNIQNNNKAFIRFDYILNKKHRLTLRHNFIHAYSQEIFRSSTNFSFPNSGYDITNYTNTTVLELQSRFNNRMSNEFRIGYNNIYDVRDNKARPFPQLRVPNSSIGTVIIGTDRFAGLNSLKQDLIEITDNFTYVRGKHTFLAGTKTEIYFFDNKFIPSFTGEWSFNSVFAPTDPQAPDYSLESGVPTFYVKEYSRTGDPKQGAQWGAINPAVYIQDTYEPTANLRLTLGLRADIPFMVNDIDYNPTFEEVFGFPNNRKPKTRVLWSPRFGVNWDVAGKGKTQVRGGVGIFTGRPPFVWLSNQYSNTGVTFGAIQLAQADLNTIFEGLSPQERDAIISDPNYLPPNAGGTQGTSLINISNPDLRLPQVARFNAAVDQELPYGIVATAEFIYSKTLNDLYVRNLNLAGKQGVLNNEGRPVYGIPGQGPVLVAPNQFTGVYSLENTDGGYQYSLTGQLQKNGKNYFANVAYTYSIAKTIASGGASRAQSNFSNTPISGDPNNPTLGFSDYNLKHRLIAAGGYTFNYSKHASTQIALFYSAQSGRPYSFTVGSGGLQDINADGVIGNELIYIPRNANEIEFTDYTTTVTDANGQEVSYTVTAAEQWEAFNAFIENEPSLKNRRGQFAERNSANAPWNHSLDVRITQNLKTEAWGINHRLQLTLDIFNVFNLLNPAWGQIRFGRGNVLLADSYNTTTGNVRYRFNQSRAVPVEYDDQGNVTKVRLEFDKYGTSSFSSLWRMQVGVRYTF